MEGGKQEGEKRRDESSVDNNDGWWYSSRLSRAIEIVTYKVHFGRRRRALVDLSRLDIMQKGS